MLIYIKEMVFITEMKGVYCAVRTGILNKILLFIFEELNKRQCTYNVTLRRVRKEIVAV
jgi:uncharacterized integral membrane protein